MKLKTELIIVGTLVLLMGAVTLVDAQEYYQLDANSKLFFTCTLDNAVPSASTTYNLSVIHRKSGEKLVDNKQATSLGQGAFSYDLVFNQTGAYTIQSFCYDGSSNYSNSEEVLVNYYGEEISVEQITIYGFGFIMILLMIAFLMIFANALPSSDAKDENGAIVQISQLKHLRLVCYIFMYGLFVALVYVTSNIAFAYIDNTLMGNILFMIFRLLFVFGLVALPLSMVYIFYRIYHDAIQKQLIERGVQQVNLGGYSW